MECKYSRNFFKVQACQKSKYTNVCCLDHPTKLLQLPKELLASKDAKMTIATF
jgi:hypothetical protein